MKFSSEPTIWLGLLRAVIVCAAAFGFSLSAEQVAGVYLVAEAVISVLNRSQVTPVTGNVVDAA